MAGMPTPPSRELPQPATLMRTIYDEPVRVVGPCPGGMVLLERLSDGVQHVVLPSEVQADSAPLPAPCAPPRAR